MGERRADAVEDCRHKDKASADKPRTQRGPVGLGVGSRNSLNEQELD